jgi:hypothetical protein
MEDTLLALAAALLLAVAIYAQRQIGNFTKGSPRTAATRLILGAVGIGFGLVSAARAESPLSATLVFLIGFGLVHVPAALILFIKRRRGSGKT